MLHKCADKILLSEKISFQDSLYSLIPHTTSHNNEKCQKSTQQRSPARCDSTYAKSCDKPSI